MQNRVTEEDVKRNMQDVLCRTEVEFGKPVTYVTVRMENGFTVRESTTCVDPSNYSEEIGKKICLEKIKDIIYLLLGYELQCRIHSGNVVSDDSTSSEPTLCLMNDVVVTAMDDVHLAFSNDVHLYQVDEDGELHISIVPQSKQNFHHELNMNSITSVTDMEAPYTYAVIGGPNLVLIKPMKNNEALYFMDGVINVIHDFKNWASQLDHELVFEITHRD